jgi:3-hydroxyacyl-CoA dehydrogenase
MKVAETEKHGRVAVIAIDNPPVNALSHAVREGLLGCLQAVAADDSVDACVLHCRGRTFIAGADIREFGQPPAAPHLPDLVLAIDAMQKPVVAALHGTALGGGLEVAMGCHYRVAEASAAVGLPEVNLGLLPGAGGTQLLPRLVGVAAALDMMLSGKPVTAEKALTLGLIDTIVDGDSLLDEALRFAEGVAGKAPRRTSALPVAAVDANVFAEQRQQVAKRSRGLVSPGKIIDCAEAAMTTDLAGGMKIERAAFTECRESSQSAGLRHAFFAERAAAKVAGLDRATETRDIKNVVVIGAGTMGAGIAHNCLTAGYRVRLLDKDKDGALRGATTVQKLLAGGVERGKLAQADADALLARFASGHDLDAVSDADLVIEAVFENMQIKQDVFRHLGQHCKAGAVLATNTSTLDVDAIAAASGRPEDVIGLHFFSPAHIMRLLEIVRGRNTSQPVLATAMALAKTLGKIGVVVGNCYGFVGNRMLYSYGRENQLLLLEGAPPEAIDKALYNWGMAMGPNAVGDLAGLDIGYNARKERSDLPDDPRFYRIANMLAEQGRYGQKTGRGMYRYEDGSRTPLPDPEVQAMINAEAERLGIRQRQIDATEIVERCIYGLVTEGARILQDGIAQRASDIDVIWINGYGFPRHRGGPMHYADAIGLDNVYATVCEFRDRFGEQYWTPPDLLADLAKNGGRFADLDKS